MFSQSNVVERGPNCHNEPRMIYGFTWAETEGFKAERAALFLRCCATAHQLIENNTLKLENKSKTSEVSQSYRFPQANGTFKACWECFADVGIWLWVIGGPVCVCVCVVVERGERVVLQRSDCAATHNHSSVTIRFKGATYSLNVWITIGVDCRGCWKKEGLRKSQNRISLLINANQRHIVAAIMSASYQTGSINDQKHIEWIVLVTDQPADQSRVGRAIYRCAMQPR